MNNHVSTLSPAGAPALHRSISVGSNDENLPPILVMAQPPPKQTRSTHSLPDSVRSLSSAIDNNASCFAPETVVSTAELCDLYRQLWREQVSPLSVQSMLSYCCGSNRIQSQSGEMVLDDDSDDDEACIFDDDESSMSVYSMASDDLDTLFTDIDSIHVRTHQILSSSPQPVVQGLERLPGRAAATESNPTMIDESDPSCFEGDEDSDMFSIASSVDTMYSFDTGFANKTDRYSR